MVHCTACRRKFNDTRGLKMHLRYCKKNELLSALSLRKRKANVQKSIAAKIGRKDTTHNACEDRQILRDRVNEDFNFDHFAPEEEPREEQIRAEVQVAPVMPEAEPESTSRAGRKRKAPRALQDYLPTSLAGLPSHIPRPEKNTRRCANKNGDSHMDLPSGSSAELEAPVEPEPITQLFETETNSFSLFRRYTTKPQTDPEEELILDEFCDSPTLAVAHDEEKGDTLRQSGMFESAKQGWRVAKKKFLSSFRYTSCYKLLVWFCESMGVLSAATADKLLKEVILDPDFHPSHFRGFNVSRALKKIDDYDRDNRVFSANDGWKEGSVKIGLPKENRRFKTEADAPTFEVGGIHYRRLLEIIKSSCQDSKSLKYHWIPFQLFAREEDSPIEIRVYTDIFNTNAMLEEDAKIRAHLGHADELDVERAILPIMIWSDSTHLASFGSASLWPIYIFFGNLSKYFRNKPSSRSSHHLAYIPSLPHTIQDAYQELFDEPATAEVLRFCKRELMQQIWCLLLDEEIINAYHEGLLILCADGVTRRIFPRFFTYSADYPEKVLLACIKYLAQHPCPRCLITTEHIPQLGTTVDRQRRQKIREDNHWLKETIADVRRWIFQQGMAINSAGIKRVLNPKSLTPTRSAFSCRLSLSEFNFYDMFVPDLMHEFELGVWKAVLTHLLRILYATGNDSIQLFNKRFRMVPTFGRDTIRRFATNVSAMNKLAARDFEDILQCIIPVMEGLLPAPHGKIVSQTLFELVQWHAYAKLRLHTEATLTLFENATRTLGASLRHFQKTTCAAYITRELPKEQAARGRRTAALAAKGKGIKGRSSEKADTKRQVLNLATYKLHALGDYVKTIRRFGPTDNYTTQTGELEHRTVKRLYARTNKNKYTGQIAKHQRRQMLLQSLKDIGKECPDDLACGPVPHRGQHAHKQPMRAALNITDADPLPFSSPLEHHHISQSQKHKMDITQWLHQNKTDPALMDFMKDLQDHLLARLLNRPYNGDEHCFTDAQRDAVKFVNNRLYRHKVLRINFTTYDMRREQDSINPRTHPDIMAYAHEEVEGDTHPYWYARIIGIFHAHVRHTGPESKVADPQRMEFLWIRWYGRDPGVQGGFDTRSLHRIGFVPFETNPTESTSSTNPFGFLDPKEVLRAVHLIPAFEHGRTRHLLPPSIVRDPKENDEDWAFYYVGMFVDRDMFMRFIGGGIGHKDIRIAHLQTTKSPHESEEEEEEEEADNDRLKEANEEDNRLDEELNYGYQSESDDENDGEQGPEADEDEDDLGPEDGEGEEGDNLYDEEGFAAL